MRALRSHEPGGPETLVVDELETPQPGEGEVLIAVKAVGINFPDTLIIRDLYQYKPPRPFSPGIELAGVIESVGPGVTGWCAGDRVLALPTWGALCEKIAVAQTIGSLSLSLRSLADSQAQLERVIASGDVKLPAGATKEEEELAIRQAMNRPIDGSTTYVTGGDVSRFQRRSKPATGDEKAAQAAAMMTQAVQAAAAASGVPAAAPMIPRGPVVNVTRGKTTMAVPVGGAQ